MWMYVTLVCTLAAGLPLAHCGSQLRIVQILQPIMPKPNVLIGLLSAFACSSA